MTTRLSLEVPSCAPRKPVQHNANRPTSELNWGAVRLCCVASISSNRLITVRKRGFSMSGKPSQNQRVAEFKTPLGKDVLALVRFEGTEGLGELFEYHVEA